MLSQWHSCPQDILQRCFSDQLDYSDNAAAACACKTWRETFVSASRASTLVYSGVRTDASPAFLRQHNDLTSLTLINLPVWDNEQSWLHPEYAAVQYHSISMSNWSETLSAVSATCQQLMLDHFLPDYDPAIELSCSVSYHTFNQFSLLQHLILKEQPGNTVAIEALSGLLGLQILEISGKDVSEKVSLVGSLSTLPSSITRLRLHGCGGYADQRMLQVEDLVHLPYLQDLSLDDVNACLGRATQTGLTLLTRLVLQYTSDFLSLHDILPLTGLRVLGLRYAVDPDSVVPLELLLRRLSCLQELDILECPGIVITPADCQQLQLLSMSFEENLLTNFSETCFDDFVLRAQTPDLVSKPVLRVDGRFLELQLQNPVTPKLFYAITYLTLLDALKWPAVFGLSEVDLPLLRVLDVRYTLQVNIPGTSPGPDMSVVALSPQLNLAELYIMDSCNSYFDLARCTSLRSVNITHTGPGKPAIGLPPFLTKLCLHSLLPASPDLELDGLQDLSSVKLGGRVASTDVTRELPSLPQSIIELDLWDGLVTNLQQLSRLTNLKKLFIPDSPNEQQLQAIRQLRQLRHVEVTGREGMHFDDGRPEPPWLYQ